MLSPTASPEDFTVPNPSESYRIESDSMGQVQVLLIATGAAD